jgi:hypothetical protein
MTAGPVTRRFPSRPPTSGSARVYEQARCLCLKAEADAVASPAMSDDTHDSLLEHLDLQMRTLGAMITLAQLDDSRTDELVPAIRDQLAMMTETVDSLLHLGPR